MSSINEEKRSFWRAQLALAERHGGSAESFCRLKGLSIHSFGYWKRKLSGRAEPLGAIVPSTFIPVEISRQFRGLPDPRWLASFILALSEGHQ